MTEENPTDAAAKMLAAVYPFARPGTIRNAIELVQTPGASAAELAAKVQEMWDREERWR